MNDIEVPEQDAGDSQHSLFKAKLNLIPAIGGCLAELFGNQVPAPIEKRKIEWMNKIVEKINELEKKQDRITEQLSKNEEFISLLISSSDIAYKTHIIEKHSLLRNALFNSINNENSYDINQIYINFIEDLTINHIAILKLINEHYKSLVNLNEYKLIYAKLLECVNQDLLESLRFEITYFRFLLKDLGSKGLLFISDEIDEIENEVYNSSSISFDNGNRGDNLPVLKLTDFGISFLEVIKSEKINR